MNEETGGPAFPHEYKYGDGTAQRCDGMTLRDYFAAKAMQSLVAIYEPSSLNGCIPDCAEAAYMYADAMLEARSKS